MPLLENLSGEHGVGPVCHELDIVNVLLASATPEVS